MSRLIRVTLEYAAHTQTLDGDDAERWMEAVNGAVGLMSVHGWAFPDVAWQQTPAQDADETEREETP